MTMTTPTPKELAAVLPISAAHGHGWATAVIKEATERGLAGTERRDQILSRAQGLIKEGKLEVPAVWEEYCRTNISPVGPGLSPCASVVTTTGRLGWRVREDIDGTIWKTVSVYRPGPRCGTLIDPNPILVLCATADGDRVSVHAIEDDELPLWCRIHRRHVDVFLDAVDKLEIKVPDDDRDRLKKIALPDEEDV